MKYAYLSLSMVLIGLMGLSFITMFQNVTVNNEAEYYVLKESVEAAMYESVDIAYFKNTGCIKILEEKFVANCTRRFFANITGIGKGYTLEFYDIMESPPKVSVIAKSKTSTYTLMSGDGLKTDDNGNLDVNDSFHTESMDFDITNRISGILEVKVPNACN